MSSATGEQYVLTHSSRAGEFSATITQLGAALRLFSVDGIDLVEPYSADALPPLCAGQVMAPWVNRLDRGQWTYRGDVLQNPINIPEQDNANHGLLLDHFYELVSQSASAVTLSGLIEPSAGYPFEVLTTVSYELTDDGLVVTHRAVNQSAEAAPFATGAHPYFKFSAANSADLILTSDAATLTVVNHRQIPVAESATVGSEFDLRSGVRIGDRQIDEDFTNLPRDEKGNAHTYLRAPDGRGLDIWQDETFRHVVIFTPNFFPTIGGGETSVAAIEPSTAAPNAFNSGRDLLWLEPGAEFVGRWGVKVTS
jgi:aldose 1-epimerase